MATVNETNQFVSEVRREAERVIDGIQNLRKLRDKADALSYLSGETVLQDADIGGENEGKTVADVTAVLGTTLENLETLLTDGHATNLHKLT